MDFVSRQEVVTSRGESASRCTQQGVARMAIVCCQNGIKSAGDGGAAVRHPSQLERLIMRSWNARILGLRINLKTRNHVFIGFPFFCVETLSG